MSRRGMMAIVAMTVGAGCVAGVGGLAVYQRMLVPGKQAVNFANARTLQSVLVDLHDRTGEYPASLREALAAWRESEDVRGERWDESRLKDNWGFPYRYVRTEDGYILASFGSDGKCDLPDLLAYAEREGLDDSPCYSGQRDTVLTSEGFQKRCAK